MIRALVLVALVGCAADEPSDDDGHGDAFPDGYGLTIHVSSPVAFDELACDLREPTVYLGVPITMYEDQSAFLRRRDDASFTALLDHTPVAAGEVTDIQYERVGNALGAEVSLTLAPLAIDLPSP